MKKRIIRQINKETKEVIKDYSMKEFSNFLLKEALKYSEGNRDEIYTATLETLINEIFLSFEYDYILIDNKIFLPTWLHNLDNYNFIVITEEKH